MELVEEPDLPNLPLGDATGWHSTPVISEKAARQLEDFLDGSAELLPVTGLPGSYFVLNVIRLIPALVEEESAVFRYPSTGLIGDISNYSLRAPMVADIPIFKLSVWPHGPVFVGDEFRDRVHRAGLTGFLWKPVWPPTSTNVRNLD
jgi:hypothetical protein